MGINGTDRSTVNLVVAAQILGISQQLLRWRAEHGHIRIALRRPIRFRLVDVLAYGEHMPAVKTQYTGRPRAADRLMQEALS
jgi:hypothetical protein